MGRRWEGLTIVGPARPKEAAHKEWHANVRPRKSDGRDGTNIVRCKSKDKDRGKREADAMHESRCAKMDAKIERQRAKNREDRKQYRIRMRSKNRKSKLVRVSG